MSETRTIHFNALPEAVRKRLIDCFDGAGVPRPIVSETSSSGGAIVGWLALALISLGGIVMLASDSFGNIYYATQDWYFVAGYVVAFFLLCYSLLAVLRHLKMKRAYPFKLGRYLFPLDYIEATSERLKITPMRALVDFSGVHHHTNGVYTHTMLHFDFEGGERQSFNVAGKERANGILADLSDQRRLIAESVESKQYEIIATLDPLMEARLSDAWDGLGDAFPPSEPTGDHLAGSIPKVLKFASIPAIVLGIVLSGPVFAARNAASDQVAFEQAKRRDTEQDYKIYLHRSWMHVEEVRDKLMPAAAFKEARAARSVTAMRDFLKRYPKAGYKKKARKHISKLYGAAYKDFKKQAAKEDKALLPFMKNLLDYLEDHGTPDVSVRFRSPDEGALGEMDKVIEGKGDVAPVSPYFTLERNKRREDIIADSLQRGFKSVFPEDILHLEKGEQLGKTSSKKVKEPTIEVRYKVLPSEHIYKSDRSARSFVGIRMEFDVSIRTPKQKKTLDFELDVEPPERFTVSYTASSFLGPLDGSGPSDGQVYDVMAARAFEELSNKMRLVFFSKDSKAFEDSSIGGADKR